MLPAVGLAVAAVQRAVAAPLALSVPTAALGIVAVARRFASIGAGVQQRGRCPAAAVRQGGFGLVQNSETTGASSAKPSARTYIHEIDIVRALAIVGVLVVHASANVTVGLAGSGRLYPFYVLLNRMAKVGTPTFIFLSSVVLFYRYGTAGNIKDIFVRFYRRRLYLVLLPYLIWSVFYFLHVAFVIRPVQPLAAGTAWQAFFDSIAWRGLLTDLANGTAYYHLYFVVISVQFYLLFPLLLMLYRSRYLKGAVPLVLGFALQWAAFGTNNPLLRFAGYLSFYGLGMFVALDPPGFFHTLRQPLRETWPQLTNIRFIAAAWLAAGLVYAWLYGTLWAGGSTYAGFVYNMAWNIYTLLSCAVLYYGGFWLHRRLPAPLLHRLAAFGRTAFGIYLVHPIILYGWQRFNPFPGSPLLTVLGGLIVIAVLSWLIVAGTHGLAPRLARVVFGASNPSQPGPLSQAGISGNM